MQHPKFSSGDIVSVNISETAMPEYHQAVVVGVKPIRNSNNVLSQWSYNVEFVAEDKSLLVEEDKLKGVLVSNKSHIKMV